MVGANEICRMDALNLARRIRAKELSPTEVIEAVLTRMEALEPHLHAFCTTNRIWRAAKRSVLRRQSSPVKMLALSPAFPSESKIWFALQAFERFPDPSLIKTLFPMKTM